MIQAVDRVADSSLCWLSSTHTKGATGLSAVVWVGAATKSPLAAERGRDCAGATSSALASAVRPRLVSRVHRIPPASAFAKASSDKYAGG